MNWKARIESDPAICGGRPRVKGTRLTVEFLLGLLAAGWSEAQVLDNYPHLCDEDLRAVFAFAQAMIEEEKYRPIPHVA
ncbi:MAG: DUF433 domain-containing protein [Xanthomonadaceae bacterium]|nr:DUF433 domain-containing protein [Xanthomonadaceae bacterium]MDP2184458.1 DUF433 domain-containing protein [Xanthomonadales bacterium]MDZ4114569.1 DUF433 domain-containing protein [Xanthomonadaceae bacterium]MDZ4377984.1 DUF433 domain-containing protein [Xanthomonadaceae bacterium]